VRTDERWRHGVSQAEESVTDAQGDNNEASDEDCFWCHYSAYSIAMRRVVGSGVRWHGAEIRCVGC